MRNRGEGEGQGGSRTEKQESEGGKRNGTWGIEIQGRGEGKQENTEDTETQGRGARKARGRREYQCQTDPKPTRVKASVKALSVGALEAKVVKFVLQRECAGKIAARLALDQRRQRVDVAEKAGRRGDYGRTCSSAGTR